MCPKNGTYWCRGFALSSQPLPLYASRISSTRCSPEITHSLMSVSRLSPCMRILSSLRIRFQTPSMSRRISGSWGPAVLARVIAPVHIILSLLCGEQKRHNSINVKFWEVIADNLSKAGWSWGCVSALDSRGRTIWIADAHRDNGKRFIVRADEKLRAFLELQRVTRESFCFPNAK